MKKQAFVVGFGLIVVATTMAQTAAWKSEYHDTMLIPPKATLVTFSDKGYQDELSYTVEEPYPAAHFIANLCDQIGQKHWAPRQGGCPNPDWSRPIGPHDDLLLFLTWDQWKGDHWDQVNYVLRYTDATGGHRLHTLHVDAYASRSAPARSRPPAVAQPNSPEKPDRSPSLVLLPIYLLILIGTILLLIFTKLGSAVFYGGPGAWLTGINLGFFGPVLVSFLSVGAILVLGVHPGLGALGPIVGTWVILVLCSAATYVAIPIVLLLMVSILAIRRIPRSVKIAHTVLGILTVAFFVICKVYFSGPFIRW